MLFNGPGRRLSQGDFGVVARQINVPTFALLAITEVETSGRGVDTTGRPIILFEPHVFDRNLPAEQRAAARRAIVDGRPLAYPKWRQDYPAGNSAQYRRLEAAMKINHDAALKACSWGLGQILGENFLELGYGNVTKFVEDAVTGEPAQLAQMAHLLRAWKLLDAMRALPDLDAARTIARRWNGKGYAKNSYHTKIANAASKHMEPVRPATVPSPNVNVLSFGKRNEAVRNLQADLVALGYDTNGVDGRFGNGTLAAVKLFQERSGLTVDGRVGPKTAAAIDSAAAKLEHGAPTTHTFETRDDDGDGAPSISADSVVEPVTPVVVAPAAEPEPTANVVDLSAYSNPNVIKLAQTLLRDCGYPEVGNADGTFAERTRGAILAFEADNSLPLTGTIGPKLLEVLATRPMRAVSAKRADAKVSDIADATGVKIGNYIKVGGAITAAFGGIGGLFDASASFDDIERAAMQVGSAIDMAKGLSPWVVLTLVGLGALWAGRKQIADQLAKYRNGNHV